MNLASNRPSRVAFWAKHDADLVSMLEDQGLTPREAAERLGVTRNAVLGRSWRIRVVYVPPPKEPAFSFPPKGACVYPHGDPGEPGFRFCEAPADLGRPYCGEHLALCYRRAPPAQQEEAA